MKIALLTHPKQPLDERFYLFRIAGLWRRDGHDVRLVDDPRAPADADLAVPHLRLTALPKPYLESLRRHPRALNARGIADISKRRVSRLLLERKTSYDGPAIVKTDRNAHGFGEALLGPSRVYEYHVYASASEIPAEVWSNPDLVVERFEPELRDGLFWLRTWDFLGDAETGALYASRNPVAQGADLEFRSVLEEVPDELRRIRAELGLDYGSFDYGVDAGQVFLYDVNWTPGFHDRLPPERADALARRLADGLRSFA